MVLFAGGGRHDMDQLDKFKLKSPSIPKWMSKKTRDDFNPLKKGPYKAVYVPRVKGVTLDGPKGSLHRGPQPAGGLARATRPAGGFPLIGGREAFSTLDYSYQSGFGKS